MMETSPEHLWILEELMGVLRPSLENALPPGSATPTVQGFTIFSPPEEECPEAAPEAGGRKRDLPQGIVENPKGQGHKRQAGKDEQGDGKRKAFEPVKTKGNI